MMNVPMLKKSQLPRGTYGLLPVKTISAGTKLGEQSRALTSLTRCFGNAQLIGKIVMLGMLVASGQLYAEGADQALFINSDGKIGIGTDKPKAQLDIQQDIRVGTQPASAIGLYVTGKFAPDKGVEFRHSNETEGIGFGHNTIYATGSN